MNFAHYAYNAEKTEKRIESSAFHHELSDERGVLNTLAKDISRQGKSTNLGSSI